MVERNAKWEQLERDYPDIKSEWDSNTNSYFTDFTEFNTRDNTGSSTNGYFSRDTVTRNASIGSTLIGSFIRMLVRELKLPPHEIQSWSLSSLSYMMADLLNKCDNSAYNMIMSSEKFKKEMNTKRL